MVDFVGFESIEWGALVFRIKICGVRLEEDVRMAAGSGADAIGLNFFPKSVRFVDPQQESTKTLSRLAKESGLTRVGVFVNESVEAMAGIADSVGLDALQLHGDESIDVAEQLIQQGYDVIRAIKLPRGPLDVEAIDALAQPWADLGCHLLLDVDAGAAHGGSGKTLDWPSVAAWARAHPDLAWTLAGGLRPENVAESIRVAGAVSVDTASGAECPRGVKNAGRVAAFVAAADPS